MLMYSGWTIEDWLSAYQSGKLKPSEAVRALVNSLDAKDPVWISLANEPLLQSQLENLPLLEQGIIPAHLPLYGVPFVVKDNIDVAGFPTSVACPAFAYVPEVDAPAVALLRRAGAIVIAKTNMDQFATGLVGVRSPYGIPGNPFHKDYIPGGSSSGSAVAVARGLVPFSLGTDTAGSGRVPAGFNNIVGWKPTRGYVSGRGVVPACRTLDCISVFAMTVQDASTVGNLIGIFDPLDAYSRKKPAGTEFVPESFQFAIPTEIEWFGDSEAPKAWEATLEKLQACGAHFSPVNFAPMHELAHLLYQNAWIAERTTAVGPFTETHREDVHPIVAKIIAQGKNFSAVDMCNAEYRRAELTLKINDIISGYTALLVPTAPRFPTVQEVLEEPVSINSQLGTYTNFVNLANCCALACPGIFREDGLPFGITFIAPAWHEDVLTQVARHWEALFPWTLGATGRPFMRPAPPRSNSHRSPHRRRCSGSSPFPNAPQPSTDEPQRYLNPQNDHQFPLPPVPYSRNGTTQTRTGSLPDRCPHCRRNLVHAACRLRFFCRRNPGSSHHGDSRTRRRKPLQRVSVRAPCSGRGRRHYPLWRLEILYSRLFKRLIHGEKECLIKFSLRTVAKSPSA